MQLERVGEAMVLRMRAGKANAMGPAWLDRMETLLDDALAARTRALVITGYEGFFSAGLDLPVLDALDDEAMGAFMSGFSRTMLRIFELPMPVVAAVNGHAIAGGCVLAAACDLRLMSGGTIGLSEMRVGVPFPAVPLEVMRHLMGPAVWRLVWDAELLDPAAAQAIGLIDEVVAPESLLDAALAAAARLARISPEVFAYTKRQLQGPARDRLASVSQADEDASTQMWASPAVLAAINGFMSGLRQQSSPGEASGVSPRSIIRTPPIACPMKGNDHRAGQKPDGTYP